MNAATVHRGPDGASVYETEGITLGHNRLAVIDLSSGGLQPMESSDGRYVIVFNGELYNYRELKDELTEQCVFKTASDTEVLLAAYSVWGDSMFEKLKGIFAFGIWDAVTKSLLLARDHMGVKPMYYSFEKGILTFSSELSAFTSGDARELDPEGLSFYIGMQYVPSPLSLVKGVRKLPAGHMLRYEAGNIHVTAYSPLLISKNSGIETSKAGLYEVIDTAVERQLVSDRPLGIFLSGGLDSSIVLHHASKHMDKTRTFSVDFEMVSGAETEGEKFNADALLAKRTADIYGAEHTTYRISIEDIRSDLEVILESIDEPVANPTTISQYFLSKWVRKDGIVVALGGDGGDELFGGYTRHRMTMLAHHYQHTPKVFQALMSRVYPRAKKLGIPLGTALHLELMALKDKSLRGVVKGDVFQRKTLEDFFDGLYSLYPKDFHPADTFMQVDRRTWLPDESLMRSDKTSMRHGVELRVPLLDVDVVAYADQISVKEKTTPFIGKKILRDTYKGHLPDYLFNQPKRGWISPGAKWLRDPVINAFAKQVFSDDYYGGLSDVIDWAVVRDMLQNHVDFKEYRLLPLWNLLALQIWARKNIVRV